jgi:hypothetical protein
VPAALLALILAGCGQSAHLDNPQVPLIDGAQVLQQIKRCDEGSHVFCALDMVVTNPRFQSAGDFLVSERQYLKRLGWSLQEGEIGQERSAVSPGHRLRIVYATASGDLLALDLGWIKRPEPIAHTLSKTMFDGQPAISLMVEAGPA